MEDKLEVVEQQSGQDEGKTEDKVVTCQEQTVQLQSLDTQTDRRSDSLIPANDAIFNNQRVFKKSLPNNKLTLYLINRDLIVSDGKIDKVLGIVLVEPDYVQNKRVYGQVTLTFRYGREDEEVMGLKFCTEAIVCFAQLYPSYPELDNPNPATPLQDALVRRLGPNAHAFSMEIPAVAPPSVHLLPAKQYNGAPIGTSYDVKVYVADRADEKLLRSTTIRMGIRVVQRTNRPYPQSISHPYVSNTTSSDCKPRKARIIGHENEIVECEEFPGCHASVEKLFLLSGGPIRLEANLDRAIYDHGDSIAVHVNVNNYSHKSVKRMRVLVMQHVDVCMFNSGKFKNVVAVESEQDCCPLGPGSNFTKTYNLRPTMSTTKNWIALEDNYTKAGATLASTVVCSGTSEKDRDPFAINVSYYVQVKLLISLMGGVVSLKLPFTLVHRNPEPDLIGFPSPIRDFTRKPTQNPDKSKHESRMPVEKIRYTRANQMDDVDLIENNDTEKTT